MDHPIQKGRIAHLLLAAGASTRMGTPKQLLSWKGKSLIRHAAEIVIQSAIADRVLVVLGANRESILPELKDLSVEIVVNPDWAEGMGSTIRTGLQTLLHKKETSWDGISISLTDQPLILPEHFRSLYELWRKAPQAITAARYNGVLGVPAIFGPRFFPQLLALQGAAGARKILMQAEEQVIAMDLPEARYDLDTPEDYQNLRNRDQ